MHGNDSLRGTTEEHLREGPYSRDYIEGITRMDILLINVIAMTRVYLVVDVRASRRLPCPR